MIERRIQQTIEHIAHRWDGVNRNLLAPLFPLLAEGRPVPLEALAFSGRHCLNELHSQLVLAGAEFDDAGSVVGLGGIALAGGSHNVVMGDTFLFTCCAVTAHTVSILLGRPAVIRSRDPVSGQNIKLSVAPETVKDSEPAASVATFIPLDVPQNLPGLSGRFCNYVRYFESARTAGAYDFGGRSFLLLNPLQVHQAAKLWVQLIWGERAGTD